MYQLPGNRTFTSLQLDEQDREYHDEMKKALLSWPVVSIRMRMGGRGWMEMGHVRCRITRAGFFNDGQPLLVTLTMLKLTVRPQLFVFVFFPQGYCS